MPLWSCCARTEPSPPARWRSPAREPARALPSEARPGQDARADPARRARSDGRTSAEKARRGQPASFVIQEHHARSLHWDFRLERDGVLVSWAVPKGLPMDRGVNHLAVHVEDHPLEYGSFAGRIPDHEYGAGTVTIWDSGSYECTEWTDKSVKVTLHGSRVNGPLRPVPHRRRQLDDPPDRPGARRAGSRSRAHPARCSPPPPTSSPSPTGTGPTSSSGTACGRWSTSTAAGPGRCRRTDRDVTASYPELRALGEALGSVQAVLDGEIVALDDRRQAELRGAAAADEHRRAGPGPAPGRERPGHLHDLRPLAPRRPLGPRGPLPRAPQAARGPGAGRAPLGDRRLRRRAGERPCCKRRATPGSRASSRNGSTARTGPGVRDPSWRKVKNFRTQSVLIGGWAAGQGNLEGELGALLLGVPGQKGLDYVGRVGTGFQRRGAHGAAPPPVGSRRRATRPSRPRSRAPRRPVCTGWSPSSWVRCALASGPGPAACASPRGGACARTSAPEEVVVEP